MRKFITAILLSVVMLTASFCFVPYGFAAEGNITDGLVAHFCFDGNLNDSSPSANTGVQVGNISYVNGVSDKAALFDGKSYIEVNSSSSLNLADNFSISVWLYKNYDHNTGLVPIVQKLRSESSANQEPYTLSDYQMFPRFVFATQLGYDRQECTSYVDIHKWELVTVTFEGSEMRFYVNGEMKDAIQYSGTLLTSEGKLTIGKMIDADETLFYKGYMDDLRIYNRKLEPNDVETLYSGMATGSGKDAITHPNKLVAWYKLNGNTDDSSGFANNAKYVGSGAPAYVDALQGKGLVFNGSSYLEVADNDPQELDKAFTFSAWVSTVKKSDINDDAYPIFAKMNCSLCPEIPAYQLQYRHLSGDNERINFDGIDQGTSSNNGEIEQDFPSTYLTWKMITVTNDGTDTKVYVNGVLKGTAAYTAPLFHSGGKLYIGRSAYESEANVFFKGSMDELRIYNYALTDKQVTDLYSYRDKIVLTSNAAALQALKKGGKALKLKVSLVPPDKTPATDITTRVKYASSASKVFAAANGTLTIKGKGKGNLILTLGPLSSTIPVNVK